MFADVSESILDFLPSVALRGNFGTMTVDVLAETSRWVNSN